MVHGEIWTIKELFVYPNEYIYWSIQIVMYPLMTGLVAGAFVLSSLYHVFGIINSRTWRDSPWYFPSPCCWWRRCRCCST